MRFVVLTLMWGYVLCPGLAYLLIRVVPLEQSYAVGMILVAMAPGATSLPAMVNKARGDLSYTAPFLLLTSVVTVACMPVAVPVLAKGISADAWTIGKPLLLLVMLPMLIGLAAQSISPLIAARVAPFTRYRREVHDLFLAHPRVLHQFLRQRTPAFDRGLCDRHSNPFLLNVIGCILLAQPGPESESEECLEPGDVHAQSWRRVRAVSRCSAC